MEDNVINSILGLDVFQLIISDLSKHSRAYIKWIGIYMEKKKLTLEKGWAVSIKLSLACVQYESPLYFFSFLLW